MIGPVLRVCSSLLILLLATACSGSGDVGPARPEATRNPYAQLYAAVEDALLHSSELADPKTVAQANRHYGFTGDSPLRVARFSDRNAFDICVVDRAAATYYSRGPRWGFLGKGDCAHPGRDAVAVFDGRRLRWVRGGDLLRGVAPRFTLLKRDR